MKMLEIPNLLDIQKTPYEQLLQKNVPVDMRADEGLESLFRKTFPVVSDDGLISLEYVNYMLEEPVDTVEECIHKKNTYESRIKVKFRLVVNEKIQAQEASRKPKAAKEQDIYIGSIPLMTENGSFVVNGIERVVVSQLLRCPGVYFKEEGQVGQRNMYSAKIYPSRGLWMELIVDNHNVMYAHISRKKLCATLLLKAMGYTEAEIIKTFYPNPGDIPNDSVITATLAKDGADTKETALKIIYGELRPGYPEILKEAVKFFNSLFFSPDTYDLSGPGRNQVNKKLGLNYEDRCLTQDDIIKALQYLLGLIENGVGVTDDIDHLSNKRVRLSAEIVKEHFGEGLNRFASAVKDRMGLIDKRKPLSIKPYDLINTKVLMTVVNDFFARNQLSQFLDSTNPLSEVTHKRRITSIGEGGVKERKRAGFEVRDVHYTHFGKICPIETPEGANIGLINTLAVHSKVDEMGFIKTPYFKVEKGVVTDEIVYLTADKEDLYLIAPPDAPVDKKTGKLMAEEIKAKVAGGTFKEVPREEIDYIGVAPMQIVSVSASLIPFLEHDDSNRALMGSNMQRQSVPLVKTEAPIVKTGMEKYVVRDSGIVLKAKNDGVVTYADGRKIVIKKDVAGIFPWDENDTYLFNTFVRTNQDTCLNQRPVVDVGMKVKKGEIISDGPSVSKEGELALGKNLLAAFMPWHGYNYEDAILISERVVKEDTFTSIHISEFEVQSRETELGYEEITADLPNTPEEKLRNLDAEGIIRVGAEVEAEDILVGKITPRGESELTPEEKLLRVIFGEKAKDVNNTSLRVPPGTKGVVINVRKYKRREDVSEEEIDADLQELENKYNEKANIVKKVVTDELNKLRESGKISHRLSNNTDSWDRFLAKIGDKKLKEKALYIIDIAKGELSKIDDQYKNEKNKIKRGNELQADVICKVVVEIASKKKLSVGDKMSGRHGNKGVVSRILPEEDMPFLKDGTPVDIVLNPLGVPSRLNIGQVLEMHLGSALKALGYSQETAVFESITEMEIKDKLKSAGLPESGKRTLYHGQTGEPFEQDITVGYMYMMKLDHLADKKIHARSTGSYSLITQQPLGGRAQFGGQRFGEMEVWALEGYGAAHTLKEILTVKSDDTEGRKAMYESIAKGLDYRGNNLPESFRVLRKELQGFGLDMKIEDKMVEGKKQDVVSIRIPPPMVVRSWSHGEVKKAETLNYRTFKPEKDGLFCEKIFGPTRDYECSCGKYKKIRFKGRICDRCGVEVTASSVRRERMGHIELATPVSYVWLFKSISNWLGILLDGMSQAELEMVLYYQRYIVTDPGDTPLEEKALLTEAEYNENLERYGNKFKAGIGAEAIQELLKKLDLKEIEEEIKHRISSKKNKSYTLRRALIKKLRMVEGLLKTDVKPEFLITSIIPVTPPDLRPLLPLDGGRFVASDLNDLYQRVINRNNRLKKLIKLQAPDIIVRNEKRMLQEAVDALLDNGKHGSAILGKGRRPLKSISDSLRGKQGRFRQNLLGKRVDYSGRAVVVVGPELKLNECGLPKEMALELFGPFVLHELRKREYFHTLGSAKRAIRENRQEVWEILEKVSKNHSVMLNRQPTLHRLSIQAFEPRLIEGNVLKLHPLVCPAFNADFDGDTMSVHLPLTPEARLETELLIKATNHILAPYNGKPIVTPTRDIVMGCSYLTYMSDEKEHISEFPPDFNEALMLHRMDLVELHQPLKVRDKDSKIITTTVGRIIFNEIIPEELPFKNENFQNKKLEALIEEMFAACGNEKTVDFLDKVMDLGFEYATKSGITVGIDDLTVPPIKEKLVRNAKKEMTKIEKNYSLGIISDGEKYNRTIDIWTSVTNELTDEVMKTIEKDVSARPFRLNPIHLMLTSGARGNKSQANQLMGMRGLMIRPTKKATGGIGEIIETPVISNFRDGLELLEYFTSIHGGRKGLVDTALKTADAGYLSRRLVDVSHSIIIREEDCGTLEGVLISTLMDGEMELIPLKERIIGRVALDPVVDIVTDQVIVKRGDFIDEEAADKISDLGVTRIKIRSVLTCKAEKGLCAKCYGWDLSRKEPVSLGEAVGVIAAQSIGEPGTQLTLRTFHTGGTASRGAGVASITSKTDGLIKYGENCKVVKNREGKDILIQREGSLILYDKRGREVDNYSLRVGATIEIPDNAEVEMGQVIAKWDAYSTPVLTEKGGVVEYKDIVVGKTSRLEVDNKTGLTRQEIITHKEDMDPQVIIKNKEGRIVGDYHIPEGAHITVAPGEEVFAGDILAKRSRSESRVQDITGGLPSVSELFEARIPKNPAIVSEIDGVVEVLSSEKGMRKIRISNEETGTFKEYQVPFGKHLNISANDVVLAGTKLTDGPVILRDILKIQGEKKVQEYLLNEIQKIYKVEGVTINDKHIEVIIRQMLSKVRVEDPGDTYLLQGEEIAKSSVQQINDALPKGKKRATFKPLVLGITRVSISSESFISAASFQETTKVLSNAALLGYQDNLVGLKENVILGRVIPAGTGCFTYEEREELPIPYVEEAAVLDLQEDN